MNHDRIKGKALAGAIWAFSAGIQFGITVLRPTVFSTVAMVVCIVLSVMYVGTLLSYLKEVENGHS